MWKCFVHTGFSTCRNIYTCIILRWFSYGHNIIGYIVLKKICYIAVNFSSTRMLIMYNRDGQIRLRSQHAYVSRIVLVICVTHYTVGTCRARLEQRVKNDTPIWYIDSKESNWYIWYGAVLFMFMTNEILQGNV